MDESEDAAVGAYLASLDWAHAACVTQYESRRPSAPPASEIR